MGASRDREGRREESEEEDERDRKKRRDRKEKVRGRGEESDSDDGEKDGRVKEKGSKRESDKRSSRSSGRRRDGSDEEEEEEKKERRREKKKGSSKRRRGSDEEESSDDGEDDDEGSSEEERRRRKKVKEKKRRAKERSSSSKKKRSSSSKRRRDHSSEESGSDSEDEDSEEEGGRGGKGDRGGGSGVSELELREYLAKKAQRKAEKLAKKLRQNVVSGYTNDSNPFGDTNLTETFVWRKKIEKDVLQGNLDPKQVTLKAEKQRLESRMEEIEKVKKRREERLLEKARHEEEMALLARERARAEFQDWEEKEDQFHFEQSKVRSEIRLREGRAKPIDVLARNLSLSPDFDVEINEPYRIYKGLTVKEMEELKEDIQLHLEFDKNVPLHSEFWTAMMVVCNHEIAEAMRRDILDRARVRGEEPPPEVMAEERGLHSSVDAEVDTTLATKSSKELSEMEASIQHQMESGSAKLVEYWESVLKRLKVYRAKARLREIHAELLRQHLALLQEAEEGREGAGMEAGDWDEPDAAKGHEGEELGEPGSYSPELVTEEEAAAEGLMIVDGEAGAAQARQGAGKGGEARGEGEEGGEGGFSPQLMHVYEGDDVVVDPEEDKAEQERKRASALEQHQKRAQPLPQPQPQLQGAQAAAAGTEGAARPGSGADLSAAERAQALKMMGPADGDAILGQGAEVNLESQVYWWHDKFRPRKPKYFNRVHTGYEWNKYNQTHYDHDNPPPKIVQGYKFNIFYPDLIDRSKAPTYSIEKDGSNGETCLIRFHAGPPYEDIGFRIVNKEWEYSHKKGFKCTFDRGILHVYINFKRYRYRR